MQTFNNKLFHRQAKNKVGNLKISNNHTIGNKVLNFLQELGKTLQFPIAVLPFAAILNRLGSLGITYTTHTGADNIMIITNQVGYWISFIIQKPGGVVFDNLPLLFALGTAFGLAKDHRGEVALIGGAFYLVIYAMTSIEHSLPEMIYKNVLTFKSFDGTQAHTWSSLFYVPVYDDKHNITKAIYVLNIGVLGGITAGCLSAHLYNKYQNIKLPQTLAFFSGRRFVPMIALSLAIPVALTFAIIWPWFQWVLVKFGQAVANPNNPAVAIPGTAIYAVLNRLLLPFGLHQILNTFFWFQLPINGFVIDPITGHEGTVKEWINGDINAFTKGIEGSGLFQSGFFSVMMGGIPAIAVAMIYCAKKENRKAVSGFLGGVALVSFISGITEPIEFSFVFLSPVLLAVHAGITGIFMAISTSMHIQIGFGFSAGLIDYIVSFAQSWGFANHNTGVYHITSNPLWVLLLVPICAFVYFNVFYYLIKKLNIQTPGREDDYVDPNKVLATQAQTTANLDINSNSNTAHSNDKYYQKAELIIAAVGRDNFVTVDNCATRLRLIVKDTSKIDQNLVKKSGAYGTKILGKEAVQIVIGTDVEHLTNALHNILKI